MRRRDLAAAGFPASTAFRIPTATAGTCLKDRAVKPHFRRVDRNVPRSAPWL